MKSKKQPPGRVRDAIIKVLKDSEAPLTVARIEDGVRKEIGETPTSSIRSYLRLNTPGLFVREARGVYRTGVHQSSPRQPRLEQMEAWETPFAYGKSNLHHHECFSWIERRPPHSVHAIVTDPPYGLHEYTEEQQSKLRAGRGGVWRLPPAFDGHRRSPVPRFTTLDESQLQELQAFFLGNYSPPCP